MNILKGLIHCGICGKNFNFKNNNGQYEYICMTKKNYGKQRCDSMTIKEQFLIDIIEKHCNLLNKNFTINKVKLFVREIRVTDTEIKIFYKDGTTSLVNSCNIVF